jgi:hypothetical protein
MTYKLGGTVLVVSTIIPGQRQLKLPISYVCDKRAWLWVLLCFPDLHNNSKTIPPRACRSIKSAMFPSVDVKTAGALKRSPVFRFILQVTRVTRSTIDRLDGPPVEVSSCRFRKIRFGSAMIIPRLLTVLLPLLTLGCHHFLNAGLGLHNTLSKFTQYVE